MTEAHDQILGTAAKVAELLSDDSVASMYGTQGAQLYHNLTMNESAEISEILGIIEGAPGPLLELACGSGRITVPILKTGVEVTGLDLSESMLELFQSRLAQSGIPGLSDRLTVVNGDMTSFSLNQKFQTIVLGASAVWNVDAVKRADLFRSVKEHLVEDGRFLVTLIEFEGLEEATQPFETTIVFVADQSEPPAIVTLFDYVDPAAALRSTNFMTQVVMNGDVVKSLLFTALTYLVAPSALEQELEAEGLTVKTRHEITSGYDVLKASARPVGVKLLEITHA